MGRRNADLVALLPIKGHSERVPSKNFRTLAGKPLCRWILDTLLSMPEIELVVINTDARERLRTLGIVGDERVLIHDRMPHICGADVSMNRIIADDIAHVAAETYLMTHATNPLLSAATIRAALARFSDATAAGTADSLFTVRRYQTRFYRADGSPINHNPTELIRTQDLEPWYEENSNLYIFTKTSFTESGARIGVRPLLFESPKIESFDIDDMDDWRIAEAMALRSGTGA